MAELIRDDGGVPIPQYQVPSGSAFEASQGSDGALHVKVLESTSTAVGSVSDSPASSGDGSLIALTKALRDVLIALDTHTVANGTVAVSNQPTAIAVNNFPAQFNVGNFPQSFEVSNFPATVTVSNQPETIEVSNLTAIPVQRASTVDIGAISVETTAVLANVNGSNKANRIKLVVANASESDTVYIGTASTVTVATGLPIKAGTSFEIDLKDTSSQSFYLITDATSAVDVRIMEYA